MSSDLDTNNMVITGTIYTNQFNSLDNNSRDALFNAMKQGVISSHSYNTFVYGRHVTGDDWDYSLNNSVRSSFGDPAMIYNQLDMNRSRFD